MGMQERAFRPLAVSVWVPHSATAQTINLNYNNGTRTLRVSNESSTNLAVHINLVTAATTTNSIHILPSATEYITIPVGTTSISTISTADNANVGYHLTIGEGRS